MTTEEKAAKYEEIRDWLCNAKARMLVDPLQATIATGLINVLKINEPATPLGGSGVTMLAAVASDSEDIGIGNLLEDSGDGVTVRKAKDFRVDTSKLEPDKHSKAAKKIEEDMLSAMLSVCSVCPHEKICSPKETFRCVSKRAMIPIKEDN